VKEFRRKKMPSDDLMQIDEDTEGWGTLRRFPASRVSGGQKSHPVDGATVSSSRF
jgi:hypothetical protein